MTFNRRSAGVLVAGFCTFINIYAPQAILPALAKEFGVPLARTGLTITAPLIAVAVLAPFVGTFSDRVGRKILIVGAAGLLTIPTLLVADARSFEAMLLWRFIQGVLFPFIFAVTVAYVGDECEGADAIRTAGTYALGTLCGGFAGRFFAGIAADFGGWRSAFVFIAALTALGAVFVAIVLPRERKFRPMQGGVRAAATAYGEHLQNPRLLATCVVGFGMLFVMVATFTYVNFYLAAPPFGLDPAELGFVFAVYLLAIPTTPFAARLAVHVGRRRAIGIAIAAALAGCAMSLLHWLPAVIAGLAFLCAGLFACQALSIGFIGATVARAKSSAVALYVTTFYVGGAIGGILPAMLWQHFGWPGVVALLAVVLLAMLTAAQALGASRLRSSGAEQPPHAGGERAGDRLAVDMHAVAHHPAPAHHHVAHRRAVAAEHPGVEQPVAVAADQGRVLGVEHHQIGEASRRDLAGVARPSACAPPAAARASKAAATEAPWRVSSRCGPGSPAGGRIPASAVPRPGCADIAVGADAEPAALRQIVAERENAVAEIGLGGLAQAGDSAAAGEPRAFVRGRCAWRGSGTSADRQVRGRAAMRPGRAPLQARQSVDLACCCSATWIWIGVAGPSASRLRSPQPAHRA